MRKRLNGRGRPIPPVRCARSLVALHCAHCLQTDRYPDKPIAEYTDFDKHYPPDRYRTRTMLPCNRAHDCPGPLRYGEEAAPNARVWRIYRDRATEGDNDLIEGWQDTLSMLLIFVSSMCSSVGGCFTSFALAIGGSVLGGGYGVLRRSVSQ